MKLSHTTVLMDMCVSIWIYVSMYSGDMLIALSSVEGQLFKGSFVQAKIGKERAKSPSTSAISAPQRTTGNTKKPLERNAKSPLECRILRCEEIDREAKCVVVLERLPQLHRVEKVFSDFKGQNIAVIRNEPITRSLCFIFRYDINVHLVFGLWSFQSVRIPSSFPIFICH